MKIMRENEFNSCVKFSLTHELSPKALQINFNVDKFSERSVRDVIVAQQPIQSPLPWRKSILYDVINDTMSRWDETVNVNLQFWAARMRFAWRVVKYVLIRLRPHNLIPFMILFKWNEC